MKFIIHANNVPWQKEYLSRFVDGLASLGHSVFHTMDDVADETGINIIFANNSWKLTHQQCLNKMVPVITVGRCFFGDRFEMVAIGWDGFNGAADFCLTDTMPSDRWEKHAVPLPGISWKEDGYVLVCGEYREVGPWYNELSEELKGEDVRYRAHPFRTAKNESIRWKPAPAAGQDDIAKVLAGARVCITYDSIAGCDAVLAGVPSITYGENARARDVSFHSWRAFKEWEKTCDGYPFDVELWADRLAYCQWSHDEISRGEWWTHLEAGLEHRIEQADLHAYLSKTTRMRKHHRLMKWPVTNDK